MNTKETEQLMFMVCKRNRKPVNTIATKTKQTENKSLFAYLNIDKV